MRSNANGSSPDAASGFRKIAIARMKAEPKYWAEVLSRAAARRSTIDLQYSLSDRIRYYWPDPEIARAQATMFRNLTDNPPPAALISQYLPIAYAAMRDGTIGRDPGRTRHGECQRGARSVSGCGDAVKETTHA